MLQRPMLGPPRAEAGTCEVGVFIAGRDQREEGQQAAKNTDAGPRRQATGWGRAADVHRRGDVRGRQDAAAHSMLLLEQSPFAAGSVVTFRAYVVGAFVI